MGQISWSALDILTIATQQKLAGEEQNLRDWFAEFSERFSMAPFLDLNDQIQSIKRVTAQVWFKTSN